MKKRSATLITDKKGRLYHIGCRRGDLAERILMVGDPKRVDVVAGHFDQIRYRGSHREYVMVSGTYKGLDVSVFATGMGQDTTEIAVIEICQVTKNPTFIRCGTTGSLQPHMGLGDLIISRASLRMDGTTSYFVHDGYPATADPGVILAIAAACVRTGSRFHLGITASAAGFYGAQARETPGFPVRFPGLPDELARQGVANFEMETATLFTLASLRGVRAGAVCAVVANRPHDRFITPKRLKEAEVRCVKTSLEAFLVLDRMDRDSKRRKLPFWVPSEIPE